MPGGVADRDGHLLPGDRLMFVNETDLEGSSLDYAVHVLKSTGYGPVHIGVAKPLPVCEEKTFLFNFISVWGAFYAFIGYLTVEGN